MSSPSASLQIRVPHVRRSLIASTMGLFSLFCVATSAKATLPPWLQHVVGASTIESALYRAMQLPSIQALYPRPPKESQTELAHLIAATPDKAELYELRARADEQSLDESAAESDWKLYTTRAKDPIAAKLELADFYHRRLLIPQEIATLNEVAAAPPIATEDYIVPTQQRSWRAFTRLLFLIRDQGLPPAQTSATFNAFLTRYPTEPIVYAASLQFQLDQKDYAAAEAIIPRYRKQFPLDQIFPIRAQALIESRRGNPDAALAVYDKAFQPLWPAELIQSYFTLLTETHRQRAFVAAARAQLAAHPDGPEALNALARIFYYDSLAQQGGGLIVAQQTLDAFRIARESRNGAWTPVDLYTLATLTSATHSYAEAARYNFALASTEGTLLNGEPVAQSGLAGLVNILLQAPDQPLALGSQNLTLYRDIAALDQGPGYWNGILSLWLNGTSPQTEYNAENAKAQSYFHRSKAAELLAQLDQRFPNAPERPALHAQLISALAQYGEPAAVVASGKEFLAAFPSAPEHLDVASLMADAYARQNDTTAEFALYDSQLAELSAKTAGLPLTSAAPTIAPTTPDPEVDVSLQDRTGTYTGGIVAKPSPLAAQPTRRTLPDATAYARILDRYLGRLTATGQLPRALTVLRGQLDRNPNDPLLYERLATFLQQNNLSAQQEQVFEQAIAKFQQPTYYDKLARFYLREKKRDAFATLTHQVTDIFSGTDLDRYFANVNTSQPIGPQLALQLNQYAAKRFPHDLVFTQNLLNAYQSTGTADRVAYDALIRNHWWESPELQTEFLTYLSRTGKLQSELEALNHLVDSPGAPSQTASSSEVGSKTSNPAALHELAELNIFTSHFEQAAPLLSTVATLYPADSDTGDQVISLFRSLAYLDPTNSSTKRAVALETNLLTAEPDSPDRLATLGDLYAEATSTGGEDIPAAAPYWRKMPALHPGSTQGFLTSATIFWDYFQFDDALAQLTAARTRFHSASLFAYEAGAIEENRHDLPAAIAEYINADLHPIDPQLSLDSVLGVVNAWFKPPSDASDSNLWSTAQSFVGQPEANARLLTLATRPSTKSIVDTATAKAFAEAPTNPAALTLRADILAAQHHQPELTPLLTTLFNEALTHAATLDEATAVGNLAQSRNLTPVYERALAKQAALTLDPVQKIQLQYSLANSLEARNDLPAATKIIDSVYHSNPRILGVVRATTDFYARPVFDGKAQPQRAIATLLEAAKAATPSLARDFTLEAASRANDANDTAQARTLALGLLAQTPYDARVLDLIATSYARAHDDAGLKQFYLAQLEAARTAPNLTLDARKQDIALLRRGLIPALTRLNDFEGATNQYIALLSAFPEDSGTAQEAALYTLKHSRQPQLLDFLRTTVKQSPKDSRFAILLAQVETTFEDLPAAESAYSLAIAIRKDRVDLYTARADIEVRLSQSDPAQSELAAADYERLYLLTYHDPSWMVRLAELRARQQRPADAVKALETAYITGHAKSAADYFTVANQLSQWNLLNQARTYAEQGVALAGDNLLTPSQTNTYPQPPSAAVTYARILTRLGHADQALATLTAARHAAEVSATSPSVLAAEIARENISADEANAFRQNFATQHRSTARATLNAAVAAIGATVETFYTPEQKLVYAQALDKMHDPTETNADPQLALIAATSAGLTDREAEWRRQLLIGGQLNSADGSLEPYIALQQHRLAFAELARTLEAYAPRITFFTRNGVRMSPSHQTKDQVLKQAAQAYRDAGDTPNETRVLRTLVLANDPAVQDRYFDLLLRHDRAALTALAANSTASLADAAVNYTIAHATETQALAAVTRRAQTLPAVWRPASASLVETYFANAKSTTVPTDFTQSLASESTIADRLAAPVDPAKQLTGDLFFYYASRFGIFLSTIPAAKDNPPAEDFLPAELESSPTSATPYLNLARTYAEANNIPAAVTEYTHALELNPGNSEAPAVEDELATVLYRANRKDEALTHWHAAVAILHHMQQHAIYPEGFFTSFETVTRHLGERHLTPQFLPELESILAPYLAKNGNYRSNELLQAIYTASPTPEEGTAAILTLAASATTPDSVLADLNNAAWLSPSSAQTILERRLALAEKTAGTPDANDYALNSIRHELLRTYLANKQDAKAQALLDSIPPKQQSDGNFAQARILLAARANRLEALLATYRVAPDTAPSDQILASAANTLANQTKPDPTNARALREFVFDHKQLDHTLIPTDFLALAQSRIDTNDLTGALTLLRRLTLQPPATPNAFGAPSIAVSSQWVGSQDVTSDPNPYANTDSAASLLEHTHHPAEAIPFLESLVSEVPWDDSYKLRLGEATRDQTTCQVQCNQAMQFAVVVNDTSAPYALRVEAARDLHSTKFALGVGFHSQELNFIVAPTTPAAARQPYFAPARIAAAQLPSTASADKNTLLREAIAIAPNDPATANAELTLLLAQPATADSSATLAILRTIQNAPTPTSQSTADSDSEPDTTADAAADNTPDDDTPTRVSGNRSPNDLDAPLVTLPASASSLDLPTRIRLAAQISSANQRDGDLLAAYQYAQLAATLSKDSPQPDLTRRRDDLKSAVLLERHNALRRPTLQKELAQSIQVRPRLTASDLAREENQ
jgi:tetratricopeptide (TPR) repeat protein